MALEKGALLHDQSPGVDLADHPTARPDLDPTGAVDLAVDLAGDGDRLGRHLRGHVGLLLDQDRALALDLALDGASDADRILRAEGPVDRRVLADRALDVLADLHGR